MKVTRPVLGKILEHTQGMGVPDPDTVRRRAQEIAMIEGRLSFNREDWKQAFHELHGGHNGDGSDDDMLDTISERDMIAPSLGHHPGRTEVEDGSRSIAEELVAEGLDEAEHDRMLEARRSVDIPESR
jgi:hypothetical protein